LLKHHLNIEFAKSHQSKSPDLKQKLLGFIDIHPDIKRRIEKLYKYDIILWQRFQTLNKKYDIAKSPNPVKRKIVSKLPDFIIVGAMKAGTTALNRFCNLHPEIDTKNELHFFSPRYDRYKKGIEWYKNHFVDGKCSGEKTPCYMNDPRAMHRIATTCPQTKIIIILRDPVMRFISHRCHYNRAGLSHLQLPEFYEHPHFGVEARWRGCYAPQLFYIRELYPDVHVIFGEQLRTDPDIVMNKLFDYLEVGVFTPMGGWSDAENEYAEDERRKAQNNDTIKTLAEFYKPYNRQLYEMCNDDHILTWEGMDK
jgi:hypothetical protein